MNSERVRCSWCGNDPLYVKYHDEEWGVPVKDDKTLFEFLLLETFQAGLSWITILRKRENFREAFENTLASLKEIYAALPSDWKMFVEYKSNEPNFYSTTVADWGQSLLYATKLGPKAYTLVDLGHHLPNANIEQIVSLLLMENKLGGFQ